MSQVEKYRCLAAAATRLARLAHTPEEREAYARIAQGWLDLESTAIRNCNRGDRAEDPEPTT